MNFPAHPDHHPQGCCRSRRGPAPCSMHVVDAQTRLSLGFLAGPNTNHDTQPETAAPPMSFLTRQNACALQMYNTWRSGTLLPCVTMPTSVVGIYPPNPTKSEGAEGTPPGQKQQL